MSEVVKPDFQEASRGYPIIKKEVDGEIIEVVDIDSLTEDQFKKFCANTGTEYFKRFSINI
jgi:hypothetical protein